MNADPSPSGGGPPDHAGHARPRRICVVTGTRADFGLLQLLMDEIRARPTLRLQVVVTGSHLSPRHGLTRRDLDERGLTTDPRVDLREVDLDLERPNADSAQGVTRSLGLGVIGFAERFAELAPDLLVLLGDRTEMLAAAQAALVARLPVAHLHGGESTEGAIDEAIRHAITKMAHLHFVAAEPYRRRVIQLGEAPERVFTVGAIGLDNLARLPRLSRAQLEESLGFALGERFFLVTYHPATLGSRTPEEATRALLEALDAFPDVSLLFTRPNADTGGDGVARLLEAHVAARPGRARLVASLGQVRYLSALRLCTAVVGNSSSGILEAPACGTATVNLGERQRGRLRASSVIDCDETTPAIVAALRTALSPAFRAGLARVDSPYAGQDVSRRVVDHLAAVPLHGLLAKRFQDL